MILFNFLFKVENLIAKILILSHHENIISFRFFLFKEMNTITLFSLTIEFRIYELRKNLRMYCCLFL